VLARAQGALGYLERSATADIGSALGSLFGRATEPAHRLLIIADDAEQETLRALVGDGDVEIVAATSADEAIEVLEDQPFQCVLIARHVGGDEGVAIAARISKTASLGDLPIVLDGTEPLGDDVEVQARHMAELTPLKIARRPEQLVDEVSMFLHRPVETMPDEQRRMVDEFHQGASLDGGKVLVVDDDIRNIFAVASALERQRATVLHAESGKDGLAILDEQPDVEVVLMDIMMPEMDGYEAIRRIRAQERFRSLPIIALTAKAMKADRDKCIEAGASDYISKPVDMAKLLSMIRVCRRR
jgi:CheY-like chemotaxis protein